MVRGDAGDDGLGQAGASPCACEVAAQNTPENRYWREQHATEAQFDRSLTKPTPTALFPRSPHSAQWNQRELCLCTLPQSASGRPMPQLKADLGVSQNQTIQENHDVVRSPAFYLLDLQHSAWTALVLVGAAPRLLGAGPAILPHKNMLKSQLFQCHCVQSLLVPWRRVKTFSKYCYSDCLCFPGMEQIG